MSDDSNVQLSNSLISLDGLAKPVTRLIEKLADGIGVLYRSRQIKNLAEAEVEAAKIRTRGAFEIAEIEGRGLARLIEQQGRYQNNFENIVRLAIPEVKDHAAPENIDNDWLTRFFEESKLISNGEMQSLWARILAGEANTTGTFSKRTLQFVSGLDKTDAEMFTRLMGFAWFIDDEYVPFIYDEEHSLYRDNGIRFDTLTHLDAIGLITFGSPSEFVRTQLPKVTLASYFDTTVRLEFEGAENNELSFGRVVLTRVGQELGPISGATKVEKFVEYCLEEWQKEIVAISSISPKDA